MLVQECDLSGIEGKESSDQISYGQGIVDSDRYSAHTIKN